MIMGRTEADQRQVMLGQNDKQYKHARHDQEDGQWMIMGVDLHHQDNNRPPSLTTTSSTSLEEDSSISNGSSTSSSDLVDDASSSASSSNSSSNSNNGPLFELSELMTQLPIKRGLSKFYQGKSQSFTSLSRVMSIEDLAKKETPYRKKMKSCKSYGGGLDIKATISKKVPSSRASFSSLSSPSAGRRSSFLGSSSTRPPVIPLQKHF